MSNDSENKFTLPLIGGCFVAMLVFALCWPQEQADLSHDFLYMLVFIASAVLFSGASVVTEVKRDDPNFDKFRYIAMAFAVIFCIWCGAYKSDRAAKVDDKIEYKYKK